MTINELDGVKVVTDIPEKKLKEGMIGTVVHVHVSPRPAYLVEFCDKLGRTNALHSLFSEQIKKADITHKEYLEYLKSESLPYKPEDGFCVDPNS